MQDSIVGISLAISIGMFLIAILIMAGYSIRSIIEGKHDMQKVLVQLLSFVIFGIAWFIMGDATEAGMVTMLGMMGVLTLYIAVSGLVKSFK